MSFTNCGNRIFHQQTLILHHIHKFSSGNTLGIWICFDYGVKKIKLIALNPTLKVAIKKSIQNLTLTYWINMKISPTAKIEENDFSIGS